VKRAHWIFYNRAKKSKFTAF